MSDTTSDTGRDVSQIKSVLGPIDWSEPMLIPRKIDYLAKPESEFDLFSESSIPLNYQMREDHVSKTLFQDYESDHEPYSEEIFSGPSHSDLPFFGLGMLSSDRRT